MLSPNAVRILAQIDKLLEDNAMVRDLQPSFDAVSIQFAGALSMAALVYGAQSPQVVALRDADKASRQANSTFSQFLRLSAVARGTLRNLKSEIEAGLVGSLERRGQGVVIADMLSMSKEALDDPKYLAVAAVLAAAAFEDTIRRLGESLAGVNDRRKLDAVLLALKGADVLTGPTFATAQGYLTFRNHALHADWDKLNAALVGSVIAFVEGLVLQHFS